MQTDNDIHQTVTDWSKEQVAEFVNESNSSLDFKNTWMSMEVKPKNSFIYIYIHIHCKNKGF